MEILQHFFHPPPSPQETAGAGGGRAVGRGERKRDGVESGV